MHSQFFFFIVVFIIYSAINTYVFLRGRQALPSSKKIRVAYATIYFLLYASFIIAMLGRNSLPLAIQKILYIPGTVWLGVMLYLLLFFIVTDLIYFTNRFFHYLPEKIVSHFRKIQVFSGYILVLCLSVYGYYQFTHPQIVEQKIRINKQAGHYKSLKIVGVSDLHLGVGIDKNRLAEYVRLINDQHPDAIIIAGDIIDNNALPLEIGRMWEELNQLQAPLGVYACLGNHEYLSGIEASMNFLQKTNLHLLIDNSTLVANSFQIVGRDDKQRSLNRKPLKELVKNTDAALPLLLLDHEPYHLEEAEENGIDLQFSGHTHNGQIWPGNLFTGILYEQSHGYKQKGNTHYFVTSGLGLWGPPFRIGTQSELVVFNIEFK
jgi:predicted MPP superfamily phosphohydrolase